VPRRPAALPLPTPDRRRWFRQRLLAWYRQNGRRLPWRETSDPYHILVSEMMLQQTQVDRVLPKYHEWLARYPSFAELSRAEEADVIRTWYPLGYNIRPRRLQAIARETMERFSGTLPDDEETLLSFKGIGAYTVGAVRSFAFGKRAAILDTNVARVLFRIFVGKGDPASHRLKKHLWALSWTVLPRRHVFDFNQALMDFGATACSARTPICASRAPSSRSSARAAASGSDAPVCPMAKHCRSYPITVPPAKRRRGPARSRS
jgi:A/G-specific adenine glycosylase